MKDKNLLMTKISSSTQVEHSAAEAVRVIADAAGKATAAIADASLAATKLLAIQAAEATKVKDAKDGNDHDLIIEIKTIQQTMLGEVREIKTGTAQSITDLQNQKLNVNDSYPVLYKKGVDDKQADHETRLNKLETINTRVMVMISIGTFALTFLIGLIVYHIIGPN